jgi:NCAIR mutase (PurE)-related protein
MKKTTEPSLTKLANAAFRQAARKVIQRAKETGTPIIVWEEGQIRERTAEEMERKVSRKPRRAKTSGPRR